jgi:type III secretory pathway lipoprotein EscJ
VRRIVLTVLLGCAPTVDGPVERQRAADLADGDRLAAELAALPGAVSARVTLHRPAADPLTLASPSPAGAAILVVVDDKADRGATLDDARALIRAAVPEIVEAKLVIEVGAKRAELARVGPFTVEAGSRGLLRGVLAALLALVAALAGYVAWRLAPRK